jgi:hypothetical protein
LTYLFLGALSKVPRATIRFVLSILLSAWNSSAPTGRIFMKVDIWVCFGNLSRKFEFQ